MQTKNTTRVFRSLEDYFANRVGDENGVSPEIAMKYPDFEFQNETNRRCWNAVDSMHSVDSQTISSCMHMRESNNCSETIRGIRCETIEMCLRLRDCRDVESSFDLESSQDCIDVYNQSNAIAETGFVQLTPTLDDVPNCRAAVCQAWLDIRDLENPTLTDVFKSLLKNCSYVERSRRWADNRLFCVMAVYRAVGTQHRQSLISWELGGERLRNQCRLFAESILAETIEKNS